jgi:DNA (cytosine-5)-methyltransferase 1
LVHEIFRILIDKKSKAFILENVKSLVTHNKGQTFSHIKRNLENVGYDVYYDILEAKDFNLPQIRKRLFVVGFNKSLKIHDFNFSKPSFGEKIKRYFKRKNRKKLCIYHKGGGTTFWNKQ